MSRFLVLLLLTPTILAAETPGTCVTTSDDIVDPTDGLISLREAVTYAGTGNCGSEITFKLSETWVNLTNTLTLGKPLTIDGMNHGTASGSSTIEFNCEMGTCFEISAGATVSMRYGIVRSNASAFSNYGDLRLTDVFVTFCYGLNGGGVYNEGTFTATGCEFQNNTAESGGGLYNVGFATIETTTFGGCSANGGPGGAVYNEGDLILENVYFGMNSQYQLYEWDEENQQDILIGANGGALYNAGFATIDRATFLMNGAGENGLALANASNGVLQVNNAVFNIHQFYGDWEERTNGLPSIVWNDSGGMLTLVQSSFADETIQLSEYLMYEKWDEYLYPCVGIADGAADTYILNCAFNAYETNALSGASNAVVRGCAFTTNTNHLFTALMQEGDGMAQLALVPVTNLNQTYASVALRKTVGMLEWQDGDTWQTTDVQIPYWSEAALARDLLGKSRGATAVPHYPGALATAEHLEGLSATVTTDEDISLPTDGLISLREAFRYGVLLAHVSSGEGVSGIEVQHNAVCLDCTLTEGPIIINAPGRRIVYSTRDGGGELSRVSVDLGLTSRFLDIQANAELYLEGVTVKNAVSTDDDGGGGVCMRSGGFAQFSDCIFSNCTASADGGALALKGDTACALYDCSFLACGAGGDGGALFAAGSLVATGLTCAECSAGGRGGALYVAHLGGAAYMHLGVFRRNRATQGGAIWADSGIINYAAFYDNVATLQGGALSGEIALVRYSAFMRNTAPHGAAIEALGTARKVIYNATFYGNAATDATGAAIESPASPLRLGNCSTWQNTAGGLPRLVRGDGSVAAFNSVLPEVTSADGLTLDPVTRIDCATNASACYLCEPDAAPSLAKVGTSAALCPALNLPATGITCVMRNEDAYDLAYFSSDGAVAGQWLDADGAAVSEGTANVDDDQFGRSRGDYLTWEYGIGSLTGNGGETALDTVTTLTGDDNATDGRITLNEAISYLHTQAQWDDTGPVFQVHFDVSDTTNRILKMTSEMRLTTAASTNFGENKVLIVDGDCGDGTHITIDLCGGAWFWDYSHNNNFIFRNLTFCNGGGSAPMFVFSDVLKKGVTGAVRFENCTFADSATSGTACVQSDKPVTFAQCTFRNCAGSGNGALLHVCAPLVVTNCAFRNTAAAGSGIIYARGGTTLQNCSITDTQMASGAVAVLDLGDVAEGITTNLAVNLAVCHTTWADVDAPGCIVKCNGAVADLGNVTAGRNGGAGFCSAAYENTNIRILNGVIEGALAGAVTAGDFQDTCGALISRVVGTVEQAACAPSADANPGSPIAYYVRNGVTRLAVKTAAGWVGANGSAVSGGEVAVITTDLLGQSRTQGGAGYPYYTCGALTDYTAGELVVTTEKDIVDPLDGVVSLREAIASARAGSCLLSGAKRITFAIAGVRNPVIALGHTFELTDAAAFSATTPLEIYGSNHMGRVTFDGEGLYRIFHVGAGVRLVLADCQLTRGAGDVGGAIRAEGALELIRVTVSDSMATSLGGGVAGTAVTAQDCTFEDCTSANNAGAVYVDEHGSFTGANLAFYANAAEGYGSGGAVYVAQGGALAIDGATFRANTAATDGPALYADAYACAEIANANFVENVALDATWETATVFGYAATIDLPCVTAWGNAQAGGTAELPLLDGCYGALSLAEALVCESALPAGSIAEADSIRGAGAEFFVCAAGEPRVYRRSWQGVQHIFRLPSQAATAAGQSACAFDLFGNTRTNKTLGAVTLGGAIPAEEIVTLATCGACYVDLNAATLTQAVGSVVTAWPNASTEGTFRCTDKTAGPTYQLRAGVPVVHFGGTQSALKSAYAIAPALTGNAPRSVEIWFYREDLEHETETLFAFAPANGEDDWAVEIPATGANAAWHYLVSTYDGARQALYLDGRIVSAVYDRVCTIAEDGYFMVGGAWDSAASRAGRLFVGDLARVRVQAGCLTPEQILENFTAENETFKRATDALAPVWWNTYWEDGVFTDGCSINILGADVAEIAGQSFATSSWQLDNGSLQLVQANISAPAAGDPQIVIGYGTGHASTLIVDEGARFTSAAAEGTVLGKDGASGSCYVRADGVVSVSHGPFVIGAGAAAGTHGSLLVSAGGRVETDELQVGADGAQGTVEVAGALVVSNLHAGTHAALAVAEGGRFELAHVETEDGAVVPLTLNGGTLALTETAVVGHLALTLMGACAIDVPEGICVTLDATSIMASGANVTLTKRGGGTLVIVPPVVGNLQYYIAEGALDLVASLQDGQHLRVGPNGLYVPRTLADCSVTWEAGVPACDYYRLVTDRTNDLDLCDLYPFYRTDGLKGPLFGKVCVDGLVTHRGVTVENPFTIVAESNTTVTIGAAAGVNDLPLRVQGGGRVAFAGEEAKYARTNGLVFAEDTTLAVPQLYLAGANTFANGILETDGLYVGYPGYDATLTLADKAKVISARGIFSEQAQGRVRFTGGCLQMSASENADAAEEAFFGQQGEAGLLTVEAAAEHTINLVVPAGVSGNLTRADCANNLHLTGAGGLRRTGAGKLAIQLPQNAILDYAGDTIFAEGRTEVVGGAAFPTGAGKGNVCLDLGAELLFANGTIHMNNLYDNGRIEVGPATTFAFGSGDVSTTLGSVLPQNVTLLKEGTGTLNVVGDYRGCCTINAGTVRLAAPQFTRYRLVVSWTNAAEVCAASNLLFRIQDKSEWVDGAVAYYALSDTLFAVERAFSTPQRLTRYVWSRRDESVARPVRWLVQGCDEGTPWVTLAQSESDASDTEGQTCALARTMALRGTAGATLLVEGCTLNVDETLAGADVVLTNGAVITVENEATLDGRLTGDGALYKSGAASLTVSATAHFAPSGEVDVGSGTLVFAAPDDVPDAGATYTLPGLVNVHAGATLRVEQANGVQFAGLKIEWQDCGTVTRLPVAATGRLEVLGVPADVDEEFALPLAVEECAGTFAHWTVTLNEVPRNDLAVEFRQGALWIVAAVEAEPIPELPAEATAADVAAALEGSEDPALIANVTTPEQYAAYRQWALKVVDASGELVGAQAVKDSETAWLSYALDSAVLIADPPIAGELSIVEAALTAGAQQFEFAIALQDVYVGTGATAENLAAVFGIEGASTLDGEFAAATVNVTFGTPVNGTVPVAVSPQDTSVTQFFIKVKMR